jgi:Ca2+/Na+ antiporter
LWLEERGVVGGILGSDVTTILLLVGLILLISIVSFLLNVLKKGAILVLVLLVLLYLVRTVL